VSVLSSVNPQKVLLKNLNPILSLLDDGPALDGKAFKLAKKFSDYYGCSLGEAIETFLPKALRHDRSTLSYSAPIKLSVKDNTVEIKPVLIHDQTRFKRWSTIIEEIQNVFKEGKCVIILTPEVSFIKETATIVQKALNCPIAIYDKKATPKNELEQWERIRKGEFQVIIGTRSAVFAPVADLGLIVIDEEENNAYKQGQSPHYHAHEVAHMRSRIDQCRIIYGSSLPSAEIWEKARRNKWKKIMFKDDRSMIVQIIDMTNYNPRKTSILSFPLQSSIQKTLEDKGTILLFMNRLGFSTRTQCQQCGFTIQCERCNVNLTYLYSKKTMACRHCNFKKQLPKMCPECKGSYLRSMGTGVEKLESEVARLYPMARIHHYDRQSKVFPKGADIIITTQAIFRRHDKWSVDLVALLNFDAQMYHIDFRSGQRAFSLLIHLRQLAKERLLIQTNMVENYCIKAIKSLDYNKFYREELKLRRGLDLPPFKHMVSIGLRGIKESTVFDQSNDLFNILEKSKVKSISISDPHPDVNPKLRDQYRFSILLKGKSVKKMLALIKSSLMGFRKKGVIMTINVDP